MSEVWSFGSNSQSRKVSIGIVVESVPKRGAGSINEHEVTVPTPDVVKTLKGGSTKGLETTTAELADPFEQSRSPWITKRSISIQAEITASKNHRIHKEPKGIKGAPLQHSIQFFSNQTAFSPQAGATKETSDGFVEENNGEKTEDAATGEKFTLTTAQITAGKAEKALNGKSENAAARENITLANGYITAHKAEKALDGKTEALRMKLWELLGTVSSPTKSKHNSQAPEMDNTLEQPQTDDQAPKPRQSSDTIKTDSGTPDCTDKKRITRSLTIKRALLKTQSEKLKKGKPSGCEQRTGEKSVFSFEESWYVGLQGTSNLCHRTFTRRMKTEAKSSVKKPYKAGIQVSKDENKIKKVAAGDKSLPTEKPRLGGSKESGLHHIHSDKNNNSREPKSSSSKHSLKQPANSELDKQDSIKNQPGSRESGQTSLENAVDPLDDLESLKNINGEPYGIEPVNRRAPAQKSCSHGSTEASLCHIDPVINGKSIGLEKATVEKVGLEEQTSKKLSGQEGIRTPGPANHNQRRGELGESSLKDFVDPIDNAGSPTFRKSPTTSPYPCSQHEKTGAEQGACNPALAADQIFTGSSISFWNFAAKASLNGSKNEARKPQGSPSVSPVPPMDSDTESSSSGSSTDDEELRDFEEDPVEMKFSPETSPIQKPKFMLRKAKRLRSYDDLHYEEQSPPSFSPKWTPENYSMQEPVQQNMEDGLTRAVQMLALALEKLKSKVKLLTSKKSSAILVSVAESVHAQLHGLESQIQTDADKLASLSKQKRQRLNTEFQEQEEQLKTVHQYFKKEVSHLLEGCRGTIEGLEDDQIELKGIMEKQKTSHRKLLVQVQEAVETQLHDADKRITSINKSAREQMQQLKSLIAYCLEGLELS